MLNFNTKMEADLTSEEKVLGKLYNIGNEDFTIDFKHKSYRVPSWAKCTILLAL